MENPIQFIKVSKFFKSEPIYIDLNFELYQGEFFGLLGGSGTGKSVFLRMIIGLEEFQSGRLLLWHQDTKSFKQKDWIKTRKRIAYAFQNGALFDRLSVFENLALVLLEHEPDLNHQEVRQQVIELLKKFHLHHSLEKKPYELSGGMQKRLGLARALILKPEIVLLDEPTAGLDPSNVLAVKNMINQLKKEGYTGILVTHDLPFAMDVCDRLGLVYEKKIQYVVTVHDLKQNPQHPIWAFGSGDLTAN